MVAIEEKILNFQKENEEAERRIVRGSDQHLDLLLTIKKILDPLTGKFESLLAEIVPDSNNLTIEEVNKILPVLLDLYSSAIKLVATLKRSAIARDMRYFTQNYYAQVESLREFIYDLEHFRSDEEDGLGKILDEINSL